MSSQFHSISLSPSNSGIVGVVPHWCRGCLSSGLLLLTGMRPENPGRAPKARCGVRHAVRPGVVVRRRSLGASRLSRGFRLVSPSVSGGCTIPGPRSIIFWTFLSQAHPSLRHAPRLPLLQSILQRRFRSTAGAAILLYLLLVFLPSRRRGSVFKQSRSVLSVCLPDRPFLSRNPAFRCQLPVLSGLPAS